MAERGSVLDVRTPERRERAAPPPRLLPLSLTFGRYWTLGREEHAKLEAPHGDLIDAVRRRNRHRCCFCGSSCGTQSSVFAEIYHVDGNHENWSPDNLRVTCPLCHDYQHPGSEASENTLVWAPEFSPVEWVNLVRSAFAAEHANAHTGRVDTFHADSMTRGDYVEALIGTTSPRALGTALQYRPALWRDFTFLLQGLRLMPSGTLMVDGRNRFGELVEQWLSDGLYASLQPDTWTPRLITARQTPSSHTSRGEG